MTNEEGGTPPAGDRLLRTLVDDPPIRAVLAIMTDSCREAARRHGVSGLDAVCLGRGLIAGALMATLTKGHEQLTLQLMGDGPLGGVTVDANDLGEVRGYVGRATMGHPGEPGQRLSTAPVLGTGGQVIVHRDLGLKEVFQGQIDIETGEVDADLLAYLIRSEQIPSLLRCDVILDEEGGIDWAAGVLVQTTPGAVAEVLEPIADRLAAGWLAAGSHPAADVDAALTNLLGQPAQMLEWRGVRFRCRCTMERVSGALLTLGAQELSEMLADGQSAEVQCRFCAENYVVGPGRLAALLAQLAEVGEPEGSPEPADSD